MAVETAELSTAPVDLEALWALRLTEGSEQVLLPEGEQVPAAEMPHRQIGLRDIINHAHYRLTEMSAHRKVALTTARATRDANPTWANRVQYTRRYLANGTLALAGVIIASKLAPGLGDMFGDAHVDVSTNLHIDTASVTDTPHFGLAAHTTHLPSAVEIAANAPDPNQDQHVILPPWNPNRGCIWNDLHQWADDHGYDHVTNHQLWEVTKRTLDYQDGVPDNGHGMTWGQAKGIGDYLRPSDKRLFDLFDASGAKHNPADATPGTNPHPGDQIPPVPPPLAPGGPGTEVVPPPEGPDNGENWWDKNLGWLCLGATAAGVTGLAIGLSRRRRRVQQPAVIPVQQSTEYRRLAAQQPPQPLTPEEIERRKKLLEDDDDEDDAR